MLVNLKEGDQVHLPLSIDVDGKSYKLREITSPKSRQYKDLCNISTDLMRIQNSINNYIQNQSNDFEYFRSLIITYRKCFADSKGRHKLEKQRDLKRAPSHLLDLHNDLIDLGNKYIAHADKTPYDQSSIYLIIDSHEKAVGIQVFRMSLENFDKNQLQTWSQLINFLKNNLSYTLNQLKDSILVESNASTKSEGDLKKKI